MWHPSVQRITRWSRSKSSFPRYKYNGKQADTGNNKQQHMPWSASAGRKGFCSSKLCISPLKSSMKALSLARTAAAEALASGCAIQKHWPSFHVSCIEGKQHIYPMKINGRDKTARSPLCSGNRSILQEAQRLVDS